MDESHATRFTLRRGRRVREQLHSWITRHQRRDESRRAFSNYRRRAQELVDCADAGLARGRSVVADRALRAEGTMGAVVGTAGCVLAGGPAFGTGAGTDRARSGGCFALGRLGASSLRTYALCRDRCGGWLFLAALYHEARSQGADLGFSVHPDRAGHSDSVLGGATRAAAARGRVCLQSVAREAEATCGA